MPLVQELGIGQRRYSAPPLRFVCCTRSGGRGPFLRVPGPNLLSPVRWVGRVRTKATEIIISGAVEAPCLSKQGPCLARYLHSDQSSRALFLFLQYKQGKQVF